MQEKDELILTGYKPCYAQNIAQAELACFSEPWSLNAVCEFFERDYNFAVIALVGDSFAGYAGYSVIAGEYQIANVAVPEEFRGSGIALAMMKEVERRARRDGCERITLEVRESNTPAISLYKKLGYVNVGIRRSFYKNPVENALLMDFIL